MRVSGIMNKIVQVFYNMKLKRKLLLSYFILKIIPLAVFSCLTYGRSSEIIRKYISYSALQSFNQTHSFLSYRLYKIIEASDIIATDKNLNEILQKDISNYEKVDQVQDMWDILMYLTSFQNKYDILKVRLYIKNGLLYSRENGNIFCIDDIESSVWYEKLKTKRGKVLCCPYSYVLEQDTKDRDNNLEILSIARTIKNQNRYEDVIALLRIDIDKRIIDNIIRSTNPTDDSITYLINSDNVIVASSDYLLLQEYGITDFNRAASFSDEKNFTEITVNNGKVFFLSREIPETDWLMATVIPYASFLMEIEKLKQAIIILILLIGTAAYAIAYIISHSITKRISRLVAQMREIQSGKINNIIENNYKDEIGELFESYNYMVRKVSSLIDEQYKLGQELKSAELKALQSQINPHFLYNTLDMINWLSLKNSTGEVNSAVRALANFYRLSLSGGKDIVTIADELKHVSYYLQIQNIRFGDKIKPVIDVDKDVLEYSIPKITLQPIVENAIHHGILEKPDKTGVITVKGRKIENTIIITVSDDGIGIPEENLKSIMLYESLSKTGSSYGIKNINERIKLIYGNDYGLNCTSVYGKGTTVEIRLAAVKY